MDKKIGTYIFLSWTLHGYAGGQSYTNTKTKWLQKQGWTVLAFDAVYRKNEPCLDYLQPFSNNTIRELIYEPFYFSKSKIRRIVDIIDLRIADRGNIVIESNAVVLCIWGEIIAKSLGAKHICYPLEENYIISNRKMFDFFYFKALRNELFFIKPRAFQHFFENYMRFDISESKSWNAVEGVNIEDIHYEQINQLPVANFNILSFGRKKSYFYDMVSSIVDFARENSNVQINLVFLGLEDDEDFKKLLNQSPNINSVCLGMLRPLPKIIFEKSDVVIASSGCAQIAFEAGNKTICICAEDHKPLGVLGYTTTSILYRTVEEQRTVASLLTEILIDGKYNFIPKLDVFIPENHSEFSKQMDYCIASDGKYYSKMSFLVENSTKSIFKRFLCSLTKKYRY